MKAFTPDSFIALASDYKRAFPHRWFSLSTRLQIVLRVALLREMAVHNAFSSPRHHRVAPDGIIFYLDSQAR